MIEIVHNSCDNLVFDIVDNVQSNSFVSSYFCIMSFKF